MVCPVHVETHEWGIDYFCPSRHKKPGKSGVLHGFADLEHDDPSYGGRKQFWHVVAKDDAGDVVSEGTFITKIVTKEHFAEKNRQREQR